MANTKRNLLTNTYSGTVAKQFVLKNRGSKSIIAGLPKKRKAVAAIIKQTQEAIRKSFRRAVLYATTAMKDTLLKEAYSAARGENQSAFNVAFQDAYKAPELANLRTDGYKGAAGQPIAVEAMDNFRISKVLFRLFAADGTLLEEGNAVQDTNGFDWVYTTQVTNPSLPGTTVQVTALDIPKNATKLEAVL